MEITTPPYPTAALALDAAIRLIGGRKVLANMLDVSVAAVGNWKVRGVPIEHCVAIEQAVNEQVTRKDLRPDDWHKYWPELAQAPANSAKAATEAVATDATHETPAAALRTGTVRRHECRRLNDLPIDADRRHSGAPFQSPDAGVA